MNVCCAHAIVAACGDKDARIAELSARLASAEPEDVQVAKAERDRALDLLAAYVKRTDKAGGFSWPDEQADARAARSLLANRARTR